MFQAYKIHTADFLIIKWGVLDELLLYQNVNISDEFPLCAERQRVKPKIVPTNWDKAFKVAMELPIVMSRVIC